MSDPQSGVVNVKIYDREYALRTSGDAERLRHLCAWLDKRMRELAASSGSADTLKVAVLAALSLADELGRARDALQEMDDIVGRRSLACVSMLDRFLC
jgi:cell division protein ZapA (FtsZ GTPase activity inhibitor)